MTRLLLFGGSGQLGTAFRALVASPWQVDAPNSRTLDLMQPLEVTRYIADTKPDIIVNAAAYTKVDDAESQRTTAFAINATAPHAMASAADALRARFIHVSTDYVFDGTGPSPYNVSAAPNPLGAYGLSKLEGERLVRQAHGDAAIVRTAWVHSGIRENFVATAVRLLASGTSMRVVDDQVGTPTRAAHLARAIAALAERSDLSGMLHFTDAGVASWYDVACCVLETIREAGRLPSGVMVTPVASTDFPRPARRPQLSILDTHASRALIGWTPPHWREGVIASTRELLDA